MPHTTSDQFSFGDDKARTWPLAGERARPSPTSPPSQGLAVLIGLTQFNERPGMSLMDTSGRLVRSVRIGPSTA